MGWGVRAKRRATRGASRGMLLVCKFWFFEGGNEDPGTLKESSFHILQLEERCSMARKGIGQSKK